MQGSLTGKKADDPAHVVRRYHTPTVGVEFYKAELLLSHGIHTTLQAS
jgi:hypothetical protein